MPSTVSEGVPTNANTAAGDPVHMPHPAGIQVSRGAWPQLVPQQHMNAPLPPQNESATESLSGYQAAYTPDQTYIQPPEFGGPTHQLQPQQLQQQQQIQDFMAELDLITFQPEGLGMWATCGMTCFLTQRRAISENPLSGCPGCTIYFYACVCC
jgi:hypothetical protein